MPPEEFDVHREARQRAAALAADLFPQERETKAKAVADKYIARDGSDVEPAAASSGLPFLVDDIEYPNMKSMLITLRAMGGENVHMRNIVAAIARSLNINLGVWDGNLRWGKTIDDSWRKF